MKKILVSIVIIIISFFIITYNYQEKEQLQSIINTKINNEDTYTPNSYSEYIDALNEAILVKEKHFASKDEINTVKNTLKSKIANLYTKPNKNDLKNKYNNAKNIDTDLYLPNSISNLRSAIYFAEVIIDDENAILEDVDDAIVKIDYAIKELVIKPDKTNLIDLITKAKKINQEDYTTESYKLLDKSITSAISILNDVNATKQQVDSAIQLLNNGINNLVIAKKGIYQIIAYAYMISNNHVGNEWGYEFFYDYNSISSGYLVTAVQDSNITISANIYEYDSITDIGTGIIQVTLKNGYTDSTEIIVRENRGRYYGNIATWKFICSVKLIKTL